MAGVVAKLNRQSVSGSVANVLSVRAYSTRILLIGLVVADPSKALLPVVHDSGTILLE